MNPGRVVGITDPDAPSQLLFVLFLMQETKGLSLESLAEGPAKTDHPFRSFDEWSSEADREAYGDL